MPLSIEARPINRLFLSEIRQPHLVNLSFDYALVLIKETFDFISKIQCLRSEALIFDNPKFSKLDVFKIAFEIDEQLLFGSRNSQRCEAFKSVLTQALKVLQAKAQVLLIDDIVQECKPSLTAWFLKSLNLFAKRQGLQLIATSINELMIPTELRDEASLICKNKFNLSEIKPCRFLSQYGNF